MGSYETSQILRRSRLQFSCSSSTLDLDKLFLYDSVYFSRFSQILIMIIETERAFRTGKAKSFLRLISALRCTPVAECAGWEHMQRFDLYRLRFLYHNCPRCISIHRYSNTRTWKTLKKHSVHSHSNSPWTWRARSIASGGRPISFRMERAWSIEYLLRLEGDLKTQWCYNWHTDRARIRSPTKTKTTSTPPPKLDKNCTFLCIYQTHELLRLSSNWSSWQNFSQKPVFNFAEFTPSQVLFCSSALTELGVRLHH